MFTNTLNTHIKNINPIYINRITALTLLVSILLNFNILYFQSIGKGVTLYSDLFQITAHSQIVEILLLLIGISILFGWPKYSSLSTLNLRNLVKENTENSKTFNNLSYSPNHVSHTWVTRVDSGDNVPLSFEGSDRELENNTLRATVKSDQYSLIAVFSILGGSLLMSSFDLLSMYLSIELQSFALYILATLNKDKLSATSAGLKYFLLGGLSSCFILLGSAIIYSYTGLTQLESINTLVSIPSSFLPSNTAQIGPELNKAFSIGLIILLVGFLFKVSAAPFYQWAPDVYDATPTIVTVWLTIVAKLTIFIFLQNIIDLPLPNITIPFAEIFNINDFSSAVINGTEFDWNNTWMIDSLLDETSYIIKNLLLICSLLSLIIGTVVGLSQIKIKRLLAFSSVSHVGFLLLALGIYTQKSVDSFLFYLIQYSITSLNIFLIILALGYFMKKSIHVARQNENFNELDLNYLAELKGQISNNSILIISLAICLFSMAGIPPLIGFFSKQLVLFSSIENGNIFLSVVAILVSVISASYYLKIVQISFFGVTPEIEEKTTNNTSVSLTRTYPNGIVKESWNVQDLVNPMGSQTEVIRNMTEIHSLIISILTSIILLFFLNPSIILNGTKLISLTYFML
jgi:NADH-ubiquinone oxidoreductase chain 2